MSIIPFISKETKDKQIDKLLWPFITDKWCRMSLGKDISKMIDYKPIGTPIVRKGKERAYPEDKCTCGGTLQIVFLTCDKSIYMLDCDGCEYKSTCCWTITSQKLAIKYIGYYYIDRNASWFRSPFYLNNQEKYENV